MIFTFKLWKPIIVQSHGFSDLFPPFIITENYAAKVKNITSTYCI